MEKWRGKKKKKGKKEKEKHGWRVSMAGRRQGQTHAYLLTVGQLGRSGNELSTLCQAVVPLNTRHTFISSIFFCCACVAS